MAMVMIPVPARLWQQTAGAEGEEGSAKAPIQWPTPGLIGLSSHNKPGGGDAWFGQLAVP
jgi:hypothetical protein